MAAVDFLSKNHDVHCAFFNHGTPDSERAFHFVANFCTERKLPMLVGSITQDKPKDESKEEYWRNQRYNFFNSISQNLGPVITAHHLDDCVETYLWSAMHGNPKVIPLRRGNVIRPFLSTTKAQFISWCQNKQLSWCVDYSNADDRFMRNYIRMNLMPHALHVNPGLFTVVKKIVEKQV